MFDAKRLLDQFLGSQGAGGNDPRQQQGGMLDAVTGGQGGQGGGLGGLAGGVGGALGSIQDLARQNPMIAGALSGGLASVLMGSKGGRKLAKNALTYGGIAAIGGLAYKAYRDYQEKQSPPAAQAPAEAPRPASSGVPVLPPPSDSPFALANAPQGADRFAQALVTAMIAAAKADGHVDADEQKRILGKLSENGLDPEEVAFLTQELTSPLDIDKVVKAAQSKEEAVEIYAASLIAITADHPAERAYLDMLAARLGLEPELARTIERTIEGATV
jgi:uncharacterized membrane protein YebE (DUF533 family)